MTDFTRDDERCKAVLLRQAQARARMKKLGIRSLLDGRPAWARVNPMGIEPEAGKVVSIKRRKK